MPLDTTRIEQTLAMHGLAYIDLLDAAIAGNVPAMELLTSINANAVDTICLSTYIERAERN